MTIYEVCTNVPGVGIRCRRFRRKSQAQKNAKDAETLLRQIAPGSTVWVNKLRE